jgi:glycosyltransferase involved in cell wall biosynthesis
MRVCLFAAASTLFGAERSLVETVQALRRLGHDVLVFAPGEGPLVHEVETLGAQTHILAYQWWMGRPGTRGGRLKRRARNLLLAPIAARLVRRWRADLVITNTLTVGIGAQAARIADRPHVWWIREFGLEDGGLAFDEGRARSLRTIARRSRFVVANSQAVADHFAPLLPDVRLRVVQQPVMVPPARRERSRLPEAIRDDFVCAMAGYIHPGKGHAEAVRAVARLRGMSRKVSLLIIGEGDRPYEEAVRDEARRRGVGPFVQLTGYQQDPYVLIASADAFLMCSQKEAFGRVTVEAMKLGIPVVGAESGGTPAILEQGRLGRLYPAGDDAALADHIAFLMDHPQDRHALAQRAKAVADVQYSGSSFEEAMRRLIEDAVRPG